MAQKRQLVLFIPSFKEVFFLKLFLSFLDIVVVSRSKLSNFSARLGHSGEIDGMMVIKRGSTDIQDVIRDYAYYGSLIEQAQ